jgi:hypothetical protein
MALIELSKEQRQSIGDATQFIRTAGRREGMQLWKEKAALIDDMLEKKSISIDDQLTKTSLGLDADPNSPKLRFAPDVKFPKEPKDPEFIKLVGLLIYAADRLKGHAIADCYSDEIAFFAAVNKNFDKYFGGLAKDDQEAVRKRKHELEKATEKFRKEAEKYPPEKKEEKKDKPSKGKIIVTDSEDK